MSSDPIPPHGTRARYNSKVAKCRCAGCRDANTGYMRLYRAAGRPPAGWQQLHLLEGC